LAVWRKWRIGGLADWRIGGLAEMAEMAEKILLLVFQ
jgi:hypothetical protein